MHSLESSFVIVKITYGNADCEARAWVNQSSLRKKEKC